MFQVSWRKGIRDADADAPFQPTPEVPLGRHRLRGEIIDSKCFLGAMRPGQGKVHKACATLCLMGGIPPMFAVYREDAPADLLLLAGPDGGPLPDALLDDTAGYISVAGELWQRDDLLVFRVDPASRQEL